jgi:hypothetical protein
MKSRGKVREEREKGVSAFLFCLSSALCSFALAHQPYWNESSPTPEQAFVIENITVSKAIFGILQAGEVAYFKIDATENFTLDSSLFVGEGCNETFSPQLYLLSPKKSGEAAFAIPEGYGAVLAEGSWQPFSTHGLVGREGPAVNQMLFAGTYYLVVEAKDAGGFYLVSIAGSENFGGSAEGRAAIPRFNACK